MFKIRRRKHVIDSWSKEEMIIEIGRYNLHLKNIYSIISMINDALIGGIYLSASIVSITGYSQKLSQILYLVGGIFFAARPLINALENIRVRADSEVESEDKEKRN